MLTSYNPGIPAGWTLDVTICEFLGSHVRPSAQGEGLTVASALGIMAGSH